MSPAAASWALAVFAVFVSVNLVPGLFSLDQFRDAWVKRVIYLHDPLNLALVARTWGAHAAHAAAAALLLGAAWGAGAAALRLGRGSRGWLAALGAGFALGGVLGLGLGLCGLFHPALAWAACAAGAAGLAAERRRFAAGWAGFAPVLRPAGGEARFLWRVLAALAAVNLLMCLAPEGGWDPAYYHLRLPKLYALGHKIRLVPWIYPSHYPQGIEMLYGLAWLLGGEPVARLVNGSFWFWCGLATWRLGARLGGNTGTRAAALALTIPLVGTLACENYIDLGLTFLELLALDAAWAGRLAEAGLLAGAAMGCKYTAIAAALGLGAALLAAGRRPAAVARVAAAAALPVLPWLLKNAALTGDPFAPLLWGALGRLGWTAGIDLGGMAIVIPHQLTASGPASAAGSLLLGLWKFARHTAFAVYTPFCMAMLPVLGWRWRGFAGFARDYTVVFTVFMLLAAPDGRYWQPAIFPACVLAAGAWGRLEASGPRLAAGVLRWLAWGSIAWGATYHAMDMHRMFTAFGAALGLEEVRPFMLRTRVPAPWYLLAVEEANLITPPGRRIAVISDVQAFLLDRDAIFDCDQPGSPRWVRNLAHHDPDEGAIGRQFRRWNVRVVLYIRGKALGAARGERWTPEAARAWTAFWTSRARLRDDVGGCALYELGPPGPPRLLYDVPGVQEMLLAGILDPALPRAERAVRFRAATAAADSGYLRGAYGELLAEEGDRAEGIMLLQQAAVIEPRAADIWFSLALALARAGRPGEARAALARGAAIRPWAEDVRTVSAAIAAAR